jgi:hypothetical protein
MTNRYAIIENGIVVNVVVADAEISSANGWIECLTAGPGWKYDGTTFIEPDPIVVSEPVAPAKEQLLAQLQTLQAQIQALS